MAKLKLTTGELAKIVENTHNNKIINVKGTSNGISFDVKINKKFLPEIVPLKFSFVEFDKNGLLVFKILLNKESKILQKGFDFILKNLSGFLNDDFAPAGISFHEQHLYINPLLLFPSRKMKVKITNVKISFATVEVEFEIIS